MSASADRNVLYGILAVQLNFVSKDALIGAMNVWLLDKARPIGEVLREQGHLSANRLQLLDALVGEQIKQHDGDSQKSLAALQNVEPTLKQQLTGIPDPAVQDSIVKIGADRSPHPVDTTATVVQPPTTMAGRYRILRPHAKGGLGEVYVAEDTELGRHIALKEIQAQHADRLDYRQRFVREAEITGGLEHPGIVPVYGLGSYPDGRPFYAMRFIKGDTFGDAIRRFHGKPTSASRSDARHYDSLDFRQLLRRFVDVCNAVAYAHSRGVLHRDLKPGNVMLGRYGETLVVDWGLAKPMGRAVSASNPADAEAALLPRTGTESSHTIAGQALGTPAYMSPEQAAGRFDKLGPAADIYSLGATLYEVLTGRVPFPRADLAAVERGDFPPPRWVRPDVPPALEAVCLKAMAPTPAGRYASAQDLAADTERWLADEPVSSYREPLGARVRRWVRKHARAVTGAVAALAVGLVGVGLVAMERERARGAIAAVQAETVKQRDRAVAARNTTRAALDAMVSGVTGESLATQKAISEEQKQFLKNVLTYYEEFAAEPGEDHEARERLARAHYSLGLIRYRLGQFEESRVMFDRTIALYDRLATDYPAVPEYGGDLARCHNELGVMLLNIGKETEAEAAWRAALGIYDRLARDFPTMPEYRQELARSHNNLAGALREQGKMTDAEAAIRASVAIRERLAVDFQTEPVYRKELARSQCNLGLLLGGLGKPAEAETAIRAGLATQVQLVTQWPEDPDYRQDLGASYEFLGNLLANVGKRTEAQTAYQAALAIRDKLAADFPGVPDYTMELAGSYGNIGNLLRDGGDAAGAVLWHTKSIERLAPLVAVEPRLATARQFLRNGYGGRADDYRQLNRHADALPDWERALELDDGSARTLILLRKADCLARLGRAADAVKEAAVLAADPRAAPDTLYNCACVYAVAAATANNPEADPHAARAVALLRQAMAKDSTDTSHLLKVSDLDPLRRRPDFVDLLWDVADSRPKP